jgi:hypothetical protein
LNLIIVPEAPLHIRKPCTEVAVAWRHCPLERE